MESSESAQTEPVTEPVATAGASGPPTRRGYEGPATGSSPDPLTSRERMAAEALRNACYHEDRGRFYSAVHRWMMFFVVVLGSTAFVSVVGYCPEWAKSHVLALAGPFTAIIGLIDLVFDPPGKARLHDRLRRESVVLRAEIQDSTIEDSSLEGSLTRLYVDDPPTMHAVSALAYNRAMKAHGRPDSDLLEVGQSARMLRHWCAYDATRFRTLGELDETKRR